MAGSDRLELEGALDRLEAALARLDKAIASPNPAEQELRALRDRHEAMRAKVGDALADLDGLLGQMEAHG